MHPIKSNYPKNYFKYFYLAVNFICTIKSFIQAKKKYTNSEGNFTRQKFTTFNTTFDTIYFLYSKYYIYVVKNICSIFILKGGNAK